MDYYCFVNWSSFQEGKPGLLPEDTPFLLLAGSPELSQWALFECDLPEEYQFLENNIEPVSKELDTLLYSAKSYPPAIALARDDMEMFCKKNGEISKEFFTEMFIKFLRQHLELQKHHPHFLAEAYVDEDDYLFKGSFYWIVGFVKETDEVKWVSDDYFIYENPASDFGLQPQKLRVLFSS